MVMDNAFGARAVAVGGTGVDAKSAPSLWLTSELVGTKVLSKQGVSFGKLEDIVVHPGKRAAYAVLAFGEWHGVGGKLVVLPWSVLRKVEPDSTKRDRSRSLVLPLDRERLKAAPSFDRKQWPSFANPVWTREVDAFGVGDFKPKTTTPPVEIPPTDTELVWRVTELRGTEVLTPDAHTLGDIRELAIDAEGRVTYATLSVGGFLEGADRLVPVPWELFKVGRVGERSARQVIKLAVTKRQLELAPEYTSATEQRPEMSDPTSVQRIYEHFRCPIYWDRAETSEGGAGSAK
jgi:sporulation protein YlmC with PRC-barrel domain